MKNAISKCSINILNWGFTSFFHLFLKGFLFWGENAISKCLESYLCAEISWVTNSDLSAEFELVRQRKKLHAHSLLESMGATKKSVKSLCLFFPK